MSFPSSGCLHAQPVFFHFLRRFHRPDHFRLCCGCCWEHFHVTSLETFHEMPLHFWLIPILRCRVNTTANCSGICNCDEATVTTSSLLFNVRTCQGYRIIGAVQPPRNRLLEQFGGSANVRRVEYIYVSCKAPNIADTDPVIASKVQNLDQWALGMPMNWQPLGSNRHVDCSPSTAGWEMLTLS